MSREIKNTIVSNHPEIFPPSIPMDNVLYLPFLSIVGSFPPISSVFISFHPWHIFFFPRHQHHGYLWCCRDEWTDSGGDAGETVPGLPGAVQQAEWELLQCLCVGLHLSQRQSKWGELYAELCGEVHQGQVTVSFSAASAWCIDGMNISRWFDTMGFLVSLGKKVVLHFTPSVLGNVFITGFGCEWDAFIDIRKGMQRLEPAIFIQM